MTSDGKPEPDARNPIRVLIVDDIERTREYVARVLSFEDDNLRREHTALD